MRTWVYKGNKKANTYLFVSKENDFSMVPDALLHLLGQLQFVLDVELHEDRKLALADTKEVMQHLDAQGFYLQLPPGDHQPEKVC